MNRITNNKELLEYNKTVAAYKAKKEELIYKFFKKIPLNWVRIRDGYSFSSEEAYDAIDYYIKTNREP